jgi:hypothetical protein
MSAYGTFRTLPIWLTMSVLWGQSGHHNCAGHHPTPACSAISMLDPTVTNWFDDPASSVKPVVPN